MKISSEFPELDDLRLVPLDNLLLHEDHDAKRLSRLREEIVADGSQANPVIVSPADDSDFLVLDGAHRVQALSQAGCSLALVQTVEPPDGAEGWQHSLCTGIDGWERALSRGLGDVDLRESNGSPDGGTGPGRPVAKVRTPDGRDMLAHPLTGSVEGRVDALWALRNIYPEASLVTRVEPDREYDFAGCVVVSYANFPLPEILQTVSLGSVLPAGVTRFRVARRVLGVKFPLELLKSQNVEEATSKLEEMVVARLDENRVRRYDEPITLFE